MSKALELIKDNVFTLLAAGNSNTSIVEAIAELEEMLKPKSCNGCKYDSELKYECSEYIDCSREYSRGDRIDRYYPKSN